MGFSNNVKMGWDESPLTYCSYAWGSIVLKSIRGFGTQRLTSSLTPSLSSFTITSGHTRRIWRRGMIPGVHMWLETGCYCQDLSGASVGCGWDGCKEDRGRRVLGTKCFHTTGVPLPPLHFSCSPHPCACWLLLLPHWESVEVKEVGV